MDSLLSASHISKKYGGNTVLKDVNLRIGKGETLALVGGNGCGKSTLLRILSGVTKPSSGAVSVLPGARAGFIPDRYEKINMTASAFLTHMAAMEGKDSKALERFYRMFFLEAMLDTPMKYLSKGTLQKVAVIQALLGERDILFVDEPLSGQDASSQANFVEEIKKRRKSGMAIIMACHEPYLIEELADSILQIKDGALADGTDYLFRCAKPGCVFLIEYHNEAADLLDTITDIDMRESISAEKCGGLIRLEADRKYADQVFRLLLDKSIRIVKYEEI